MDSFVCHRLSSVGPLAPDCVSLLALHSGRLSDKFLKHNRYPGATCPVRICAKYATERRAPFAASCLCCRSCIACSAVLSCECCFCWYCLAIRTLNDRYLPLWPSVPSRDPEGARAIFASGRGDRGHPIELRSRHAFACWLFCAGSRRLRTGLYPPMGPAAPQPTRAALVTISAAGF